MQLHNPDASPKAFSPGKATTPIRKAGTASAMQTAMIVHHRRARTVRHACCAHHLAPMCMCFPDPFHPASFRPAPFQRPHLHTQVPLCCLNMPTPPRALPTHKMHWVRQLHAPSHDYRQQPSTNLSKLDHTCPQQSRTPPALFGSQALQPQAASESCQGAIPPSTREPQQPLPLASSNTAAPPTAGCSHRSGCTTQPPPDVHARQHQQQQQACIAGPDEQLEELNTLLERLHRIGAAGMRARQARQRRAACALQEQRPKLRPAVAPTQHSRVGSQMPHDCSLI
jgi:hypothetical protein